jgi:hypothetical protein
MQNLTDQITRQQSELRRREETAKQLSARLSEVETRLSNTERDKRDLQLLSASLEKQMNDMVS